MMSPSPARVASRFLQAKSLPPFRVGDEVDVGRDPLKKLPRTPGGTPTPEFWTKPILTGTVTRVEPEAVFSPYGANPFVTLYTVDFTDPDTGESHEFKLSSDWWTKPTTRREPIDLAAADVEAVLKKNGWLKSFKRSSNAVGTPRGSRVFDYTTFTPKKGPGLSLADIMKLERERGSTPAPKVTGPSKDNTRPTVAEVIEALSRGTTRFPLERKRGNTLASTVPSGPDGETQTFPIEVRGGLTGETPVDRILISPF